MKKDDLAYSLILILVSFSIFTISSNQVLASPINISHWNNHTFSNLNTLTDDRQIEFGITFNETGDIKWYKDDVLAQTNTSVTSANFTTTFTTLGMHTVKAQMTNINGTSANTTWNVEVVETGTATISKDPAQPKIYVEDGWANLPQIYLRFKNPDMVEYVSEGVYVLKYEVMSINATVYINSSTVKELRLVYVDLPRGTLHVGGIGNRLLINNIKIVSWNDTANRETLPGELGGYISVGNGGYINMSNTWINRSYVKWFYDHTPDIIYNCTFYESGTALYHFESSNLTAVGNRFINVSKSLSENNSMWTYTNFSYNYALQSTTHASGENVLVGMGSVVMGNEIIHGGWNNIIVGTGSIARDNIIRDNGGNHNLIQPSGYSKYGWYLYNNTLYNSSPYEAIHFQGFRNATIAYTTIYNASLAIACQFCKDNYFYGLNLRSTLYAWDGCYRDFLRNSIVNATRVRFSDYDPLTYGYFKNFSIIDTRFTNGGYIAVQFDETPNPIIFVINSYNETYTTPPTVDFTVGALGDVREYVWLDVLVKDELGNPIQGANITIVNLNDSRYPALEVLLPPPPPDLKEAPENPLPRPSLRNLTVIQTFADGHIPKPNYGWSNDVEPAVALMFQKRNRTTIVNGYFYKITAEYKGIKRSVIVSPDESWYREDPESYPGVGKGTVIITMPSKTGKITGSVEDTSGNPLPGALIAAGEYSTAANNSGKYSLTLPVGTHEVIAYANGYLGEYVSVEISENQTIELNFRLDDAPKLFTYDGNGVEKDTFIQEPLYVKGINFSPDSDVDIYVVDNREWWEGMAISPFISKKTVHVNNSGEFFVLLLNNTTEGEYDIVADVGRDGFFNLTADVADNFTAMAGITATVSSTQIELNNLGFGSISADTSAFSYISKDGELLHVSDGSKATNIQPFAFINFTNDSGYVTVSLGYNRILPKNALIVIDNDDVPNLNTQTDPTQIQIEGNSENRPVITYAGENGDGKIFFDSDGYLYVFINAASAIDGVINVDIRISTD